MVFVYLWICPLKVFCFFNSYFIFIFLHLFLMQCNVIPAIVDKHNVILLLYYAAVGPVLFAHTTCYIQTIFKNKYRYSRLLCISFYYLLLRWPRFTLGIIKFSSDLFEPEVRTRLRNRLALRIYWMAFEMSPRGTRTGPSSIVIRWIFNKRIICSWQPKTA